MSKPAPLSTRTKWLIALGVAVSIPIGAVLDTGEDTPRRDFQQDKGVCTERIDSNSFDELMHGC